MGYYIIFMIMGFMLFGAMSYYYRNDRKVYTGYLALTSGAAVTISVIALSIGMFSETFDTEVWNGKVTGKERDTVSCSHSYSCNCKSVQSCSGSGPNRSCSTSQSCDTCYDHAHDYDWDVHTTIGDQTIARIDNQGVREPPRWTVIKANDPVAETHSFTNYIKAARNNVLNRQSTKISYAIPKYPEEVYDYYFIDRALSVDNAMPNLKLWSSEISKALIDLGTSKQVNLVLVFTKNPQEYAEQLNAAWLGGKKNDVIVVIGTQNAIKADWVEVLSWTKREDFKVQLRDAIMAVELAPVSTLQIVAATINHSFERRHMKEFEYLKYDIEPSEGFVITSFGLFGLPLIVFLFINKRRNNYYNSSVSRFNKRK